MHDSLLKDIQISVSAYIDEQLAKKDAELQLLKQQNKQLQQEVKKLRLQNDALRAQQQSVAKKEFPVQSVQDAEKVLAFIASTNQPDDDRLHAFFVLYRWNMKHLHYSMDVLLGLWTALAQSVKKLPRVTPELKHLHTQLTAVTSDSYPTFLTLIAHYDAKNDAYFAMITDVFYKQALKGQAPFQSFSLLVMYAYKQRNETCSNLPLYDALWQGQAEPAKRFLKDVTHLLPLLPQTGTIAQLQMKKRAPKKEVPTKEWDAFIAQATNGKFDRFTVVPTFMKLLADNKKTNMYTKDFLRSIWKRIFVHYDVAYSAFEQSVKQHKLHDYFIEADGQGVFMLIRLYNEHDAKEYMRALLDVVMKQLLSNEAYKPFDVPILLAIYYSELQKRYFANDKVATYYKQHATERAKKMRRGFEQFEAAPSRETFDHAYSEVQMVDVYLEKIGVRRKQFGTRVFAAYYTAPTPVATVVDFTIPDVVDPIEHPEAVQTLAPQYSLVRFGYKTKKMTDDARWATLLDAIAEIGLARTVQSLQYYIRLRLGDEDFADMIAIWSYDIQRLQQAYVAGEFV